MFDGLSETGFAASICAAKDVLSLPCCQNQASIVNTKDGNNNNNNKQHSNKGKSTLKIKFTEEEDMKLHRLVMQFGAKDWIKISQLMETRNPRQCRERWNNYVNPALRTDPWTPEEDMLLDQKFAEYGPKWNKISKFFVNRSDNNIRNRWMMIARHRAKSQKSPISPAPTPTQSPIATMKIPKTNIKDIIFMIENLVFLVLLFITAYVFIKIRQRKQIHPEEDEQLLPKKK